MLRRVVKAARFALLLLTGGFGAACSRKDPAGITGKGTGEKTDQSGPVTVIADPEPVESARREYVEVRRPLGLEEAVAFFEKGRYWQSERHLPSATREEALVRCLRSPSADVRLHAARLLFTDRHPDMRGRDALFDLLAAPSADTRLKALEALAANQGCEHLLWYPPAREDRERLLSLLDDPDPRVRRAAFHPCSYLPGPGLSERLLAELRALRAAGAPSDARSFLASYIVYRADSPACLEAITDLMGEEGFEDTGHILRDLQTLAIRAQPPVRDEARSRYESLFLELLGAGKPLPQDSLRFVGPRMAPALRGMLRSENPPLSRHDVLEALGRADLAASDLLDIVRKGEPRDDVNAALRGLRHASGADPEAVVRAIEALLSRVRGHIGEEAIEILLARGGPAGRRALLENFDRIQEYLQDRILWALHGWSELDVLRDLHASGILPPPPEPDAASLRRLKCELSDNPGMPYPIHHAVLEFGHLARISPLDEMRGAPIPFDEFLERMVFWTKADLPVEAVWRALERNSEKRASETCRLRFIAGNRLYEVVVPEDDNATAIQLVATALNVAADREGRRQRFISFFDGEYFTYVYADPAAVHRARMKYFLSAEPMSEEDEREYRAHRARTVLELKAKLAAAGK